MNGWDFFARHKKAAAALLLAGALGCGALLSCVKLDENIHAMIPAAVRERVELFEHSPLNKKIFIGVTADTAQAAQEAAEELRADLVRRGLLTLPPAPGPDFALTLYRGLPYRFSAKDAQAAAERLTPEAVRERMAQNYENLLSFQSFFLKDLILADPLGLTDLMAAKMAAFGAGTALEYRDGFLASPDGKTLIGPYDFPGETADFNAARRFAEGFSQAAADISSSAKAFYLGSLRYTVENVAVIQADLLKITLLAFVLLAGVFWYFFRHKTALLIYLLPVLVLPPAALVTYRVFGSLSGITLGFGSVVAGLSVDYSVYIFFALKRTRAGARETAAHMKKHLLCNFMTSALCFAALFCSSVELFRQIAVFSVTGLLLSLLLALYIFPHYWTDLPPETQASPRYTLPVLPRRAAVLVCVFLLAFGALGVTRAHFSGDVEDLNSTSAQFKQDKAAFDRVFSGVSQNSALLFVFGATPEEALEHNEALSARLPAPLAVSEVIVSNSARAENTARWREFWSASRANYARLLIEEEAGKLGLKPAAFEPFFKEVLAEPAPDTFDFTKLYNPAAELADGRFAVVNIVPNTAAYETAAREAGAVFLSASELKTDLIHAVKKEALKIVLLALLFNLAAVRWAFKSWKTAFLAFVPVVLAACFTFGCFWAFNVRVNLFILVFLPLLMGIGIDYGIFQLMRRASSGGEYANAYPASALAAAALSTLAGFGVLAFAKHGVLFIIGLSSFLGVGGAMLASLFVLPAFLQGEK